MRKLGLALALPLLLVAAVGIGAGMMPTPSSASLTPGTVPSAYAPLVERYGHLCPSLSPALLAAQLYQESGFNPHAVSDKGARGIAQFMPGTWATWGVDADGDGHTDPFDPGDAIPSAAIYDCTLAADVASVPGNRADNMLAAYNAGPYAVLAAHGVPSIAETRSYVARIHALEQPFSGGVGLPPSRAGAAAVAFAYQRLGTPYEWGGDGSDGRFDCSGLTQAAYASAGIQLPRVAAQQWYAGPHVPRDQLRAGDLVFFATDLGNPATIHHVGIYVGYDEMIDAPYTGTVIRFDTINQADYIGAVRPIG